MSFIRRISLLMQIFLVEERFKLFMHYSDTNSVGIMTIN